MDQDQQDQDQRLAIKVKAGREVGVVITCAATALGPPRSASR